MLGWLWFSENLTGAQVGGIVLVLAGIALAQTARTVRTGSDPVLIT
ncbi:MAG: hypothetical protein H0U51_03340 [Propionibacteriales bacterium]|nr:hypothetical protein [Propionibacteriales bacterium]